MLGYNSGIEFWMVVLADNYAKFNQLIQIFIQGVVEVFENKNYIRNLSSVRHRRDFNFFKYNTSVSVRNFVNYNKMDQ
jgi:hypothetical protein